MDETMGQETPPGRTWPTLPRLRSDLDRTRDRLRTEFLLKRMKSEPSGQFGAQKWEEVDRMIETGERPVFPPRMLDIEGFDLAEYRVKLRWKEQGIWNDRWNGSFLEWWKHEDPALADCGQESVEAGHETQGAETEAARLVRHREASRPIHQFNYQVAKECERIHEQSQNTASLHNRDVDAEAYHTVKNLWKKRGIWDDDWGVLPGMSWYHEKSFSAELRQIYAAHGVDGDDEGIQRYLSD